MVNSIRVPPSKSLTHRALVCAALAKGQSVIQNPLACDDTLATVSVLEALGIAIQKKEDRWIIEGDPFKNPSQPLDCNESGTTYRFFSAITQTLGIACELTGRPSLLGRPMDDRLTSQLLSGRLLAAPLLAKETVIQLSTPPISKPYIELTLDTQKKFGVDVAIEDNFRKFKVKPEVYHPATVEIEGDWSAAAVLLAAGVLQNGVVLEGLNPKSLQGDRAIVTILQEMGGDVFWEGDHLVAKPSSLRAVDWDLSQTPDLFPIVSVLNALAKGKGRLTGIERLRHKESDRVDAMEKINTRCLAPCVTFLEVDSADHRIIIAAAVLGKARGIKMEFAHPKRVAKSWPGFWEVFSSI